MRECIAIRYRLARRADPLLPASAALWRARQDTAAEDAGLPPWADGMTDEEVTIHGHEYLVTVDYDEFASVDDFDCLGEIREPSSMALESNWGEPPPVEWPTVREGGQAWSYDPGPTYSDTDHAGTLWRQGMARGPLRERQRADLLAEGWRLRQHFDHESMFRVVTVTDPTGDHLASIGWVDGLADRVWGRVWLWDTVQDLAAEVRDDIEDARRNEWTRRNALVLQHG